MNILDSRALCYGDTFAQRLSVPGQVRFRISSVAGLAFSLEDGFIINAKSPGSAKRKANQHNITVRMHEGHLMADPPKLDIEAGDLVLWSAFDRSTPAFSVSGSFEGGAFDSSALRLESVYTHAFGLAGRYEWEDANGHPVSGTVIVQNPKENAFRDHAECLKMLAKGHCVVIKGKVVEPATVEIMTGQTVFWAIEKADGITITDSQLRKPQ